MTSPERPDPISVGPARPTGPDQPRATPSVVRLRAEALRFLRGFGLVSGGWAVLLAVAAPTVDHPAWMWALVGVHVVWAVVSVGLASDRTWWVGWFVLALVSEATLPVVGTHGWSLTGGAVITVLAGVALSGRRDWMAGTVATLTLVVLARAVVSPAWSVANAVATCLVIGFGGLGLAWAVERIAAVVAERDLLQARLLAVETAAARATERAEAGARLHDTVLQHLAAIAHARDLDDARRHAGRASNDLRAFLRADRGDAGSLRRVLRDAVTRAADGVEVSVSVVGDRTVGEREQRLVEAVTEAVRNAVRHGAPPIRVHAEVAAGGDAVVWVADHGDGFDPAQIDPDRLGVAESIRGRLHRAGGRAVLRTDDTTEWELRVPDVAGSSERRR